MVNYLIEEGESGDGWMDGRRKLLLFYISNR